MQQVTCNTCFAQVNDEFMRRIISNQKIVCPECASIYPAFSNMKPDGISGSSGRRLLQSTSTKFSGTVSILLVYENGPLDGSQYNVFFSDFSKAVIAPTFTDVWSGGSDPATLQAFMDRMMASQFVVTTIESPGTSSVTSINLDLVGSGIIVPQDTPHPPPSSSQPPPNQTNGTTNVTSTPSPPPAAELAMDMTVFGVRDLSIIPASGEFKPITSDAMPARMAVRAFDPVVGIIFLVASYILFCG